VEYSTPQKKFNDKETFFLTPGLKKFKNKKS